MMEKLKALFIKYREPILYIFFGGYTTVVNYVSYLFLEHVLSVHYMAATVIAWFLSVVFAYLTNRKWVFSSQANTPGLIAKEAASFFASRIFSGVMDAALMYLCVDLLHFNSDISKLSINVLVILLNYLLSKLLVFRKKSDQ